MLSRTGRPLIHPNQNNQLPTGTISTHGLLSNEATAVMQRERVSPIGQLLVVGRKGVFNLKMLYDWWMLYTLSHNLLIKNGTYVMPNETLDALLADEYIKEGATASTPYHTQTYLRMIGRHLGYDYQIDLSSDQLSYLNNQERILRDERKRYTISKGV